MKTIAKFALGLLAVAAITSVPGCKSGGTTKGVKQNEFKDADTTTTVATFEDEPVQNWYYESEVDKMSGKTSKYASVASSNTANFEFPYDGGSRFYFIVRSGKYNDLAVRVSKGQFSSSYNRTIKMRFDDEKPMVLGFSDASDGSSDVIFPNISRNKVIAKLKKAKRLLIEAEFHQEGVVLMEFNVEGFTWQ